MANNGNKSFRPQNWAPSKNRRPVLSSNIAALDEHSEMRPRHKSLCGDNASNRKAALNLQLNVNIN
jgi:hypothetical protein